MRVTGQVLGVAVGGAVFASGLSTRAQELGGSVPQSLLQRDALILAVHDAFYVAAAICVIGIITSLVRGRKVGPPKST
jgi:hypothetical protein